MLKSFSSKSITIPPKVTTEPQANLPLIKEASSKSISFAGQSRARHTAPRCVFMRQGRQAGEQQKTWGSRP